MDNNDFLETFHSRLRGLALQRDVMQIEVADATGIAPSSISDYFSPSGKSKPPVEPVVCSTPIRGDYWLCP